MDQDTQEWAETGTQALWSAYFSSASNYALQSKVEENKKTLKQDYKTI